MRVKQKTDQKLDRKKNTMVQPARASNQGDVASQVAMPRAFHGSGSIDSQVAMLKRMKRAQRQAMLTRMGTLYGNRHVMRVVARLRQNHSADSQPTTSSSHGPPMTASASPSPAPPPLPPLLQAKLTLNEPDDAYEQEADQVANAVMRMSAPAPSADEEQDANPSPAIQRKLTISPKKAHADASGQLSSDLESRIHGLKSGGQPLPKSERHFFETRMGADFSGVRIHADTNAAQTSRDINARAFTVGHNIAFNAGEYAPGSQGGRHLLAHELTHVVQQGAAGEVQGAVQRRDMPSRAEEQASTEEEKAAALAAAKQANAKADSVRSESATQTAGEMQAAQQDAMPASGEGKRAEESVDGEQVIVPQAGEKAVAGAEQGSMVMVTDAAPRATGGFESAPASLEEDPGFQAMRHNAKRVASQEQVHIPASDAANAALAAAQQPASEIKAHAQHAQVGEMQQAETPPFDVAVFKAALMARIKAVAPQNLEEADNFKENNQLGAIKDEMKGQLASEKAASAQPMEETSQATPDTSRVKAKPVVPLSAANAGTVPADVGAEQAVPKSKGHSEVERPLQESRQQLDKQMLEAGVTEEQLAHSNEPQFQAALEAKQGAQQHAESAPPAYRQFEQGSLSQAQSEAVAVAQEKTQAMHADRGSLLAQVTSQQEAAKGQDEQARAKVGADIQQIYARTKSRVEKSLSELDGEVDRVFSTGAEQAEQAFERFVDAKMDAYKEERYGGMLGWAKWAKDKLLGMPAEVNAFYSEGRQLYLAKMDAVIDNVVAIVGKGLSEAKAEIAKGKPEIQEYVNQLPEDLKEVGQQAAQEIQGQFDELEQSVNNKQEELINTLAQKYNQKLQAIDTRIEEMKAANQGLVAQAMDAIGGTIQTIMQLKDMLLSLLAKAASAIGKIIEDPIGFLKNLISGITQGFQNFAANINTYLEQGLMEWLLGAMTQAGIQMPENFDAPGILSLVMQVLGLTWANIRARAANVLGEKVVGYLEQAFEIFTLIKEQGIGALWDFIKEQLGNLKDMVLGAIKDMVITQVIQAGIEWLIGILGGPAGAFIKAAKAVYNIVMWFVNQGSQVMSLISAILDSILAIASGAVGQAAKLIEQSLAKAIPIVIGFLASLLGLGNISEKVKGVIAKVQAPINKAIDWVLQKAKAFAKKGGKALGFGKQGKNNKDKQTQEKEGLAAIDAQEKKYLQNGAINRQDAQKVAWDVQQKHPLFQSITVIDGKDRWDYDYTIARKLKQGERKVEIGGVEFTGDDILRITREVAEEITSHPKVTAAQAELAKQGESRNLRLTSPEYILAAAMYYRKGEKAVTGVPWFIKKEDRDSITMGAEGHPLEAVEQTQSKSKYGVLMEYVKFTGRTGEYVDIQQRLAKHGISDADAAKAMQSVVQTGKLPEGISRASSLGKELTEATWLVFGTESARNPANLVTAKMALDLVESGSMSLQDALAAPRLMSQQKGGELPMTMKGALEGTYQLEDHLLREGIVSDLTYGRRPRPKHHKEKDYHSRAEELARREIDILMKWGQSKFDDKWLDENMRGLDKAEAEKKMKARIRSEMMTFYQLNVA